MNDIEQEREYMMAKCSYDDNDLFDGSIEYH